MAQSTFGGTYDIVSRLCEPFAETFCLRIAFVGTTTTRAVRLFILALDQDRVLISWRFLPGKAHEIFGQDVAALLNATIW